MSNDKTYVGVDIIKSGGRSLDKYEYAIALVRNGKVVKVDKGRLGRLVRYLWEYRPAVLATDNILEIGGTKRNLIKILHLVPPDTEFIQVTIEGGEAHTVRKLALDAGIKVEGGKLSPVKTAVVAAMLAYNGFGERLDVFEKKVKINVFKGRCGHAGGSRASKYQRSLRGAVARMVKKLREELDKRGFDYDIVIRRSKGGVESAVFTVYASREELFGVISKARGHDVEVRIKPVINRKFLKIGRPRSASRRYLIVGYDPGMQVGLAVIDLDMRPQLITSGKELDRGDILSRLTNLGIPAVIATDKNPPPEMVKKLAAMIGAQLYVPPKSLSTAEKELLVENYSRRFGITVKNTHERDALSAALKAYSVYKEKMEKLVRKVRRIGLSIKNLQRYKVRLLMNEPLSDIIEDIINDYVSPKEKDEIRQKSIAAFPQPQIDVSKYVERIKDLEIRVSELIRERDHLKEKLRNSLNIINELQREIEGLKDSINEKLMRDRKISELMTRLRNASERIRELESKMMKLSDDRKLLEKIIERVFAGELILLPKFGVRCVLGGEGLKSAFFVKDVKQLEGLDERTLNILRSKGVVLPPKYSDIVESIIEKLRIPSAVSKEVWEVSNCLVAVNNDVISGLEKARETISKLEEAERKELTYTDLVALLNEYRSMRAKMSKYEEVTQGYEEAKNN